MGTGVAAEEESMGTEAVRVDAERRAHAASALGSTLLGTTARAADPTDDGDDDGDDKDDKVYTTEVPGVLCTSEQNMKKSLQKFSNGGLRQIFVHIQQQKFSGEVPEIPLLSPDAVEVELKRFTDGEPLLLIRSIFELFMQCYRILGKFDFHLLKNPAHVPLIQVLNEMLLVPYLVDVAFRSNGAYSLQASIHLPEQRQLMNIHSGRNLKVNQFYDAIVISMNGGFIEDAIRLFAGFVRAICDLVYYYRSVVDAGLLTCAKQHCCKKLNELYGARVGKLLVIDLDQ
jgi:hypothetical protein